ncbi:integrase [Novosphingobium sp. 1529]|uniref:tyrosine-type recombinase/integrase n=1 Tax=Novosphingobium sp. 1529 TaxID=3156424 RepID=UPI003394CEA7
MANEKLPKLLRKAATQGGEEMAKPAGLISRGGSWGVRVRVPDRLRAHLGKTEIWKSFGAVGYADACRLARIERVAIDRRFLEAEAELGRASAAPLNDEELLHLARAFLHKMEVDAGPLPLLPADREAERDAVDEEASLVGQSVEDASVQRVAKSFAAWAGRKVHDGNPELLRLSEAVQQAWLEHLGRRSGRLAGRTVATVDPIFAGVDGSQPLSVPLTVRAAIAAYKNDPERSGVAAKTRAAWDFRFRAIEEILGPDRLIGSIRREDVRACRDALMKMPANAPKHFPGVPIVDATALGDRQGLPKLSAKSVMLYVELLSSLFKWLEREEMVARNPAQGIKGPPQPSEKPKRPLTTEEINALLFATEPDGQDCPSWTYWMVRIALLNGMRLGEIAGLAVNDIEKMCDIWVFRVRPNTFRELKTDASRRDVPIHPLLIERGLLNLTHCRQPDQMLLRDAPAVAGTSNAAQKRLARVVRISISDKRASFHSLRHNFRDAMRAAGTPHDIAARLGGWSSQGSEAMEGYGDGHSISVLAHWMFQIAYPGVDM